MNGPVPSADGRARIKLTFPRPMDESARVTSPSDSHGDAADPVQAEPSVPPIRRPGLFYATVTVAYGLLAAAVLALVFAP